MSPLGSTDPRLMTQTGNFFTPMKNNNPLPFSFFGARYCIHVGRSFGGIQKYGGREWRSEIEYDGCGVGRGRKILLVDISNMIKGVQKAVNEAQKLLEMYSFKSF